MKIAGRQAVQWEQDTAKRNAGGTGTTHVRQDLKVVSMTLGRSITHCCQQGRLAFTH